MKFKQFLLTEGRGKEISLDDAEKWILKNSPKRLEKTLEGNKIYRGLKQYYEAYQIDPKKSKTLRRSAYVGSNYYTLMIDNLPSWKDYPKRSQSIICTTSYPKAKGYGNVYIIFPKDNAKIGVCIDDDIFMSFVNLRKNHYYMSEWSEKLQSLDHEVSNGLSDKSWSTMKNFFKKIDDFKNKDYAEQFLKDYGFDYLMKGKSIEVFNKMMSPKKNKFQLKKGSDIIPSDREIWTDSESVLINVFNFDDVFDNDPNETYDYIDVNIKDLLIIENNLIDSYGNLYNESNRKNMPKYATVVQTTEKNKKYMVIAGFEAIVKALMQQKTKITVEINYNSNDYYYHGEEIFEYKNAYKYKGLENLYSMGRKESEEDIEETAKEWGFV
jgi:hypothetical protein